MTPPPKNDTFFEFSVGKSYMIACGDMDLFHKSTGGVMTPPYSGV